MQAWYINGVPRAASTVICLGFGAKGPLAFWVPKAASTMIRLGFGAQGALALNGAKRCMHIHLFRGWDLTALGISMVPRAARTVNCLGFWGLGALGIMGGEGCKHTLVQEAQLRTWLALSNRAGLSRLPIAVLKVCGGVSSAYLGPPPPFVSIQRCQIDTPLQSQM